MQIFESVSLRDYSTMHLGGEARFLTIIDTTEQLAEAVQWAGQKQLPILVLGGGSNVIFRDEGFAGLVIINRIAGFEVTQEDDKGATVKIGAGENWDSVVARTVNMGLSGIEFLSAIPGSAGATPVQNVGAYGAEIAQTLLELAAYNLTTHQFETLSNADCHFTYRNSIFKSPHNRHYIITSITLRLNKTIPKPPFYASLQRYLDEHGITTFRPQIIRDAVVAVRSQRLPDPSIIPNTGSFFKNPIVERDVFEKVYALHPEMPFYEVGQNQIKMLAGWLVDNAGLKGYEAHGMATYEKNALVLVNESATSYNDLAAFRDEICEKVRAKFGVTLEQEPELI